MDNKSQIQAVYLAFAHVWTLADGKLKRFQQFVDTHLHNQVLP
ncbi:hypothetical protein [Aliidiomarina sp.]|nr:hypothetical protein [Aliidiomarina sp.]